MRSVTTDVAALPAYPSESESLGAGLATRMRRWAQAVLRRWEQDEPRTPKGLLALADRVEPEMPSFAAELRFFARHRPETSPQARRRPELPDPAEIKGRRWNS